jgi:hypothetical protein
MKLNSELFVPKLIETSEETGEREREEREREERGEREERDRRERGERPISVRLSEDSGVESRGKRVAPGRPSIGWVQWTKDQSTFLSLSGSSSTGLARRSMTAQRLRRKPEDEARKGEGRCFSASLLK